jgi:hypothetical protein
MDENPHTKNMSVTLACNGELELYSEVVVPSEDTSIRVRVQRMPAECRVASEMLTLTAPGRRFMCGFIKDATAALVNGTGLTENDVFLKAWTIVQEKAGEKPVFIPVVRVMVRVQVQGTLMAKWGSVRDGTWIKTKRGYQTQVWRSRRKLREARQLDGKRPTTHSVVFVNGLRDEWQVEELAEAWRRTGISTEFDVAKIAAGRAGMIVLAPDDPVGDRELRAAELELATMAKPGVRLRLAYCAAPDRVRQQEMEERARQQDPLAATAATTRAWGTPTTPKNGQDDEVTQLLRQLVQQVAEMRQEIVET